ncbi:MAG: hypothetical protein QOH56_2962, partial [Pseudonocardiales bacterium]|nr:hypothetical protein [Pseudonocardiales bacterium]
MTVNLTTVIADPPTGRDKAVFF